jgi:hypothetical protein
MIIAVDFDGILCEDAFPAIGKPNYRVISAVRQLIDAGHDVILWTSRIHGKLTEAVQWCEDYGLHFCAVNDNAPANVERYGTNPRKVYADIYIDDRSILFLRLGRLARDKTASVDHIINEINHILKEDKNHGKD